MKKLFLYLFFLCLGIVAVFACFWEVFIAKSLIFPYAVHPFDIAKNYSNIWNVIKISYIVSFLISYSIILNKIINIVYNKKPSKIFSNLEIVKDELSIDLGKNEKNEWIKLKEKGLFQNIFITGTIGSGKTSSAMYPFTKAFIEYNALNTKDKLAMLILDVKGNYTKQVFDFSNNCGRKDDIISIDLSGKYKYNPLDKPYLKEIVLANRLKTILKLFNKNESESYWLDKAESIISEAIKFIRIYNDGYVNFTELHKIIVYKDYYFEKINITRKKFESGLLDKNMSYNLLSSINFFQKEYFSLDERTQSILKSEITRITNIFVSDYNISNSFCPPKEEVNFKGFDEVIDKGKIVVLNMNISEYKNLSKIIAAYLKIDFQETVLKNMNLYKRKTVFISDEYHEYVTDTDSSFFAISREAKCINVVATQSYSSILNALKDEKETRVIIQNLINKIWFRTDDSYTIDEIQKQIGKEDKQKVSTTISENAKSTNYNFFSGEFISRDSNISESYNKYYEKDFVYDTKFFSQELKTFNALCFLSDGTSILKPQKIELIPYFLKNKETKDLKGFDLNENF